MKKSLYIFIIMILVMSEVSAVTEMEAVLKCQSLHLQTYEDYGTQNQVSYSCCGVTNYGEPLSCIPVEEALAPEKDLSWWDKTKEQGNSVWSDMKDTYQSVKDVLNGDIFDKFKLDDDDDTVSSTFNSATDRYTYTSYTQALSSIGAESGAAVFNSTHYIEVALLDKVHKDPSSTGDLQTLLDTSTAAAPVLRTASNDIQKAKDLSLILQNYFSGTYNEYSQYPDAFKLFSDELASSTISDSARRSSLLSLINQDQSSRTSYLVTYEVENNNMITQIIAIYIKRFLQSEYLETLADDYSSFNTKYIQFNNDLSNTFSSTVTATSIQDVEHYFSASNSMGYANSMTVSANQIYYGGTKIYDAIDAEDAQGIVHGVSNLLGSLSNDSALNTLLHDNLNLDPRVLSATSNILESGLSVYNFNATTASAGLSLLNDRQGMATAVRNYSALASDISQLTGALGILSSKDQEKFNKITQYASLATTIVDSVSAFSTVASTSSALTSMGASAINPYMALGTVAFSLLQGSKGGDSQQIALLNQINEKLDVIDQKLDTVIALQQETLTAIENLDIKMSMYSIEILNKLDTIGKQIEVVGSLVEEFSERNTRLGYCDDFLNGRDELKPLINYTKSYTSLYSYANLDNLSTASYSDVVTYFERYDIEKYSDCITEINDIFSLARLSSSSVYPLLLMSKYKENYMTFKKEQYQPILDLLHLHYPKNEQVFYTLASPTFNYKFLNSKVSQLDESDLIIENIDIYKYFENTSIGEESIINPVSLVKNSLMFYELLSYKLYVNDANVLDINNTPDAFDTLFIVNQINKALSYINISIAQQNLLSGDIVLPTLHQKIFTSLDDNITEKLLKTMDKNSYLSSNYFIMQMREEMFYAGRKTGDIESYKNRFEKNMDMYKTIYECNKNGGSGCDVYMDKNLFLSNWNITGNEITLSVLGNDYLFQMPKPDDLYLNRYYYSENIKPLLALRQQFIDFVSRNFKDFELKENYNFVLLDTDGDGSYDIEDDDDDNDGISDIDELFYGLDTKNADDLLADYDDDGISNADEILSGTPIYTNHTFLQDFMNVSIVYSGYGDSGDPDRDNILNNLDIDDDNDGMLDSCEMQYPSALNQWVPDATDDYDNDGFTNLEECTKGSDPTDYRDVPLNLMNFNPAIIQFLLN